MKYSGAVCHVLDRGDRREAIFHDEEGWNLFPATLAQARKRTGWRVHAWVLTGNHYHLLLEIPEANLLAETHWLQTTCTG